MNIVVPIVGMGKRFSEAGFQDPKPLIFVKGKEIVRHSIESFGIPGNYIFVIRKGQRSSDLRSLLFDIMPDSQVIETEEMTEGAACSVLLARDLIDNNEELIIFNCDQRTEWDYRCFLDFCQNSEIEGVVTTYQHDNVVVGKSSPFSFIKIDDNKNAVMLEEKFAISDLSLCGIHYWKRGRDFVESAAEMIRKDDRINNEFYVSRTYNYLIAKGKKIRHFPIPKGQFFSLGTPEDLKIFESLRSTK
jgi:NDP-sugar pyrophosphorylase family protein